MSITTGFGVGLELAADSSQATSLLSHWKLGELSGTVAIDEQAFHNGTYSGSPTLGETPSEDFVSDGDTCVLFDGIDDVVTITDAASDYGGMDKLSIEALIKLTAYQDLPTADGNPIVAKWGTGSSSDDSYFLGVDNKQVRWVISTPAGGITDIFSSTELELNRWYHVAGVFDGQKVYIVIDFGEKESETSLYPSSFSIRNTTEPVFIGKHNGGPGNRFFNGWIDEVKIYDSIVLGQNVGIEFAVEGVVGAGGGVGIEFAVEG